MINTYKIKRDAHLGFLPLLQPQLQQLTEFCLYLERQLKFLSLCSSYAQVLVQFFLLPVWPIAVTFYLASICFPFFPFKNYLIPLKTAGLQNYYFPQIYGHLKHPVSLQEDVQTSLGFPLLFCSPHSWQTCEWVYLSPCKVCLSHSTSCICLADLFRKAHRSYVEFEGMLASAFYAITYLGWILWVFLGSKSSRATNDLSETESPGSFRQFSSGLWRLSSLAPVASGRCPEILVHLVLLRLCL